MRLLIVVALCVFVIVRDSRARKQRMQQGGQEGSPSGIPGLPLPPRSLPMSAGAKVAVIVLTSMGLLTVAFMIFMAVAISTWGSQK